MQATFSQADGGYCPPPPTQLVHNLQVAEVSVQSCFLARLSRLYAIAYVTEA